MDPRHDDRLSTIRALLAKAEATGFPAEAEAFTAKAVELMARYSIDESLVWASGRGGGRAGARPDDRPAEVRLELLRPYLSQKAVLVHEVASVFGCRSLGWSLRPGTQRDRVSIIGFPVDLELVEALVTSLFVQLSSAMLSGQPDGMTSSEVASWRRSFIMGFTEVVTDRLRVDRAAAVADSAAASPGEAGSTARSRSARAARGGVPGSGVAVALRERAEAVDDEFRQRYPRIRTTRVGIGSSTHGRQAGGRAGRGADLGHARVSGRRALGRG